MTFASVLEIVIQVSGGLGLFLIGMKLMSDGMQAIAGDRIRQLISTITDNRFIAMGVGAAVTALIQSSSITTVMVVGMVNAGIMTLIQSIGVIMGANIGTTITAWIIALKIGNYGLLFIGAAAFFYLFAKSDRVRYSAMMFVGLGMVFYGMQLMKGGFSPLRENEEFISLMYQFTPDTFFGAVKCIFIGALTTAIIQSSSATVAITISLALTGIINYDTAVALVLGENIGTTITAYLASLGASANAKRTTYAHISINVMGVLILLPVFHQYLALLKQILPETMDVASRIAFAHSAFNIFIVSIFIWMVGPLQKLVMFLVPSKSTEEKAHLTYLDIRMVETPIIAVQQSYEEIIKMGKSVQKMINWLRPSIEAGTNNEADEKRVFHREHVLDLIQKEVVEFISKLMTGTVPRQITEEARQQLRFADEYESISDYVVNALKIIIRMKKNELNFSETALNEVLALHDGIAEYLDFVFLSIQKKNTEMLPKSITNSRALRRKLKDFRNNHLNRLAAEQTTPQMSLIYMDLINTYRRIIDHAFNITEVLAGEK